MSNEVDVNEVTPESLMETFHGPGLSKMVIITIVVHAVVILGSSVPFMLRSVMGEDRSKLSKEERIDKAMADVTGELQKIAEEHGLTAQEIREQFAKGKRSKPSAAPVADPEPEVNPEPAATSEPEKPKSTIEQELEKKESGPALPDLSTDIEEEEEDLFK